MFTQFYNEALRKLVIGFGSLFNDIKVIRKNPDGTTKETIRVPLSYGPKEKFLRRIEESSSISNTSKVQITLPRLGFDITGFSYDPSRKTNKLRRRSLYTDDGTSYKYNYNEVPYIVSFGLYSFTRHQDDNLQIIEQILPYFTPEFVVSFNMNDVNKKVDVPIVLNGVSTLDDYEGDFDTRRSITSSFEFSAKTYIYGPVKTGKVILTAEVDIFGEAEKFNYPVTGAHDAKVGITGGHTGEGYTAGNQIYGEYYYE
jgi:hypothetical protein